MLDKSEYSDYICNQDVINQHIEAEVFRRTLEIKEKYEQSQQEQQKRYVELEEKYQKLYDFADNLYQSTILGEQ
ncbi:hypothetical protein [Wolbachia endosymbiont of Ctenocephalides felis wCfeT]|uniref:hypothetical protein n=1 Tax=Wolbachia endosymbiont of Ctenocephalides felis wCfeT TaxID=2732593 RepID=UPI0014460041|nr:hypothetical protein [Wolbachia endosymbiont of Ctenocephalides felis wCfeT]